MEILSSILWAHFLLLLLFSDVYFARAGFSVLLALSLVAASRGTLQSGARASHCGGFSCRGARAPRCTGPAAAAPGLLAPRHVGYSRPGTRPVSPASAAGLFTPSDQGSPVDTFKWNCLQHQSFFLGGGSSLSIFPFYCLFFWCHI